ncbi:MAG: tyrosine-type recombinase/integrase [Casimicrobium sp.]
MGRKRINADPLRPLPKGLYLHKDGRYRSPKQGGGNQYFGRDYEAACHDYRVWRGEATSMRGSVAELLEWYIALIAPTRVSARTLADYRGYMDRCLIPVLGHIQANKLTANDLARYRDARSVDAPSQFAKEMAPLSQAYRFGIENGRLNYNPVADVIMPKKAPKRPRYVTDAEYLAIYNAETTPNVIRRAMTLAWRTLQEPGDLVRMGWKNVVERNGERYLDTTRSKTHVGALVKIEGELAKLIDSTPKHVQHFIYGDRYDGRSYTSHGLAGMFYKAAQAQGIEDIGLKDIRAKGATDMDNAGTDRRTIQKLLNHKSLQTTEIYLKHNNPAPVRMNTRTIAA